MTAAGSTSMLTDAMLKRFAERAPGYDRDNRFFEEDFADLKQAGYLTAAVPRELGGGGLTFAQMMQEQRRLATYAHATALGINMHLYWTGVAADVWRSGDKSLEWLLTGAVKGEVYAAGHAEKGNDIPLLMSSAKAEPVTGGYRFTGHKHFGSLTPVWTFLGVHGLDTSDPAAPKVVHAFMPRATEGYSIKDTWDVVGMRATSSQDTILEGAFVPDRYVARVVPAGFAGADLFVLAIFQWALTGFANVYCGMARRAIDLAVAGLKNKTSLAVSRSMAYHPEIQHAFAEMALALDPLEPHLDKLAEDWSAGVDHGANWPAKIVSAKYHAVEACWRIVDRAMEVSGGAGMFRANELERLFRDARCGRFHPANTFLTHEIVGKTALGIDLGEQPRWG